ncbi:Tail-specific protease OS=Stutzerimonas stutzeri OX=316 GN=CXK95_12460 PE=3 SV=1 [Stutzerimonas stutzeri]
MKRTLACTVFTLLFGLQASLALAKSGDAPKWDYLQPDREQVIASLNVVELLKRHHYNKPPLNDARSAKIFDSYIEMLDPARSYFLESDLAEFNRWRTEFDDFLKRGNLEPGFLIYKRHLERLEDRLTYALDLLQQGVDKIDFTVDETLLVDREKAAWAKDRAELDDLWRKRVKDEVLRLKIAGKEPKAIEELLTKRYKNQLARLEQTRGEDVFQTYINAFAQSYDPHTQYLSPDNAENFDINMSLSLEGIGAVLQSDNEHVKIVRLVPAGPAEKSKQLAPADKIIGVAQSDDEMVDVIGWRLDEVVKLIRGPKGSVVRLEVIPASNAPNDQTSKIVAITREAVKLEEQAAKKSVLNLEHQGQQFKLGVIEIPAFYLDFKALRAGDQNYKSATRDVKKLLTELQQEKVDGVVIDLRNNGGGSLQEATELTGLFIDQGPTVLVRNADGRVDVLADENVGAFYKGPLAVLVNRLSASASENLRWRHAGLSPRADPRRADVRQRHRADHPAAQSRRTEADPGQVLPGFRAEHPAPGSDSGYQLSGRCRHQGNRRKRAARGNALGQHPRRDQSGYEPVQAVPRRTQGTPRSAHRAESGLRVHA